jgi:hypothetical protein
MEPGTEAGGDRKPAGDASIDVLRAEVVGTGRDTRQMRILIAWSLALALPVLIAALGLATNTPGLLIAGACFGPVLFGLVGYGVAVGMVGRYHDRYRSRLRSRLAELSLPQRVQLLNTLHHEREGDTRRIVAPLLAELGPLPKEVSPSAAPAGSGQELNPTGPTEESEASG